MGCRGRFYTAEASLGGPEQQAVARPRASEFASSLRANSLELRPSGDEEQGASIVGWLATTTRAVCRPSSPRACASRITSGVRAAALAALEEDLNRSFYGFEPDFFHQNVARIVDDVVSVFRSALVAHARGDMLPGEAQARPAHGPREQQGPEPSRRERAPASSPRLTLDEHTRRQEPVGGDHGDAGCGRPRRRITGFRDATAEGFSPRIEAPWSRRISAHDGGSNAAKSNGWAPP
jgi:hypothetical protein